MKPVEFEEKLKRLDRSLFNAIRAQLHTNDKVTLLAIQQAFRKVFPDYVYLEIGSYLGGSLQPYYLDPLCRHIYSIDNRIAIAPDERGSIKIPENSHQTMLNNLKALSEPNLKKLTCIEADSKGLGNAQFNPPPNLCFIDGEHTNEAVMRDFLLCLKAIGPSGVLYFHDANIIFEGLREATLHLTKLKIPFRAYNLPAFVFVIEVGRPFLYKDPVISEALANNYLGYLPSLLSMAHYREFYLSSRREVIAESNRDEGRPQR